MTKFMQQTSTKCVVFVVDSRKDHLGAIDVRAHLKTIAKTVAPECHVLVLCNKQDLSDQNVLAVDEITRMLDIERTFVQHPHSVIGCALHQDDGLNTLQIV